MYIPLLLYGGKSAQLVSYGFNIRNKSEGCPHEKKNSLWGYGFFKKGFKSNRFQVIVWSRNLRFSYFSFGFIFKRSSSPKRARSARRAAKPRETAKRQIRKPCTFKPCAPQPSVLPAFSTCRPLTFWL